MTTLFPVEEIPAKPTRRKPLVDFGPGVNAGKAWEKQMNELAGLLGWRTAYFYAVNVVNQGWKTPVGGNGKGWLDHVYSRERTIFAELKYGTGALSSPQQGWVLWHLEAGAEVYVFRPEYLDEIADVLRHKTRPSDDHPARATLLELLNLELPKGDRTCP